MVYLYTCVSYVEGWYMYVCVLPVLHIRCSHSLHRMNTHTHYPPCTYLPRRANPYTYMIYTCVCVSYLEDGIYMYVFHMWRGGVCTYVFYLESCMCFLTRSYMHTCVLYLYNVCMCIHPTWYIHIIMYVYTTLQIRCPYAYTQTTTSMYNTHIPTSK